jgi:hypothetical protein
LEIAALSLYYLWNCNSRHSVESRFPPSDPGKESCREEGVAGVPVLSLQFHSIASIFLSLRRVQRVPYSRRHYVFFSSYPLFLRDFAFSGGIHNRRRSSSRHWCGGEAESGRLSNRGSEDRTSRNSKVSICGPYNQKLHCTLCSCFGFYGSS